MFYPRAVVDGGLNPFTILGLGEHLIRLGPLHYHGLVVDDEKAWLWEGTDEGLKPLGVWKWHGE